MKQPTRFILLASLIIGLVICVWGGACSAAAVPAQKPLWPHEQSDLAADPDVIFGRLPNGFRYALLPNRNPRERISLHLVVNAGSLHEREDQRGIAHFLEHMLFNGSTHFAPGELVKYFQKIGMQFGPDANASTSFFKTVYDINLPQNDRDSLSEALTVMGDYAAGALLLPAEIEREREVILAEKRTRDSADYRTYVASLAYELNGTLFPERLPIGTDEVIRNADREVFQAFYDAWYRPDNMVLVMVGDFDPAIASELVDRHFQDMQPRGASGVTPEIGRLRTPEAPIFYHFEPESGNTTVTLQVLASVPERVDTAAYKKERMENHLIGMILQNRLDRILSRPDPPFTDASAGIGIFLRQIAYGYISADCPPEDWRSALEKIEKIMRQALNHGFDTTEVDRVRRDMAAELERRIDQAGTRESGHLARQLIHSFSADHVFQSPAQEKAFYQPLLASVTPEILNARLRSAWKPDNRQVLVTGNTPLAGSHIAPSDIIYGVYQASVGQPVAAPEMVPEARFPYLPEPPALSGPPPERELIADLGITRVRLRNGVWLNLKPTDFSDNEIVFALSLEGGQAIEPTAKPGLAALTRDVINESGVGALDREALQIALTGQTTRLAFGFNNERFYFRGQSTPKEIRLLFQLLQTHLADPAFRPQAYQLVQERFAQDYQRMVQSVDAAFRLHGQRFLSGGDPRFGSPRLEEFQRLQLTDVEGWIRPILTESPLELSLVGDFDLETAIALAQQYLGGLPPRGSDEIEIALGPRFPSGQHKEVAIDTRIDKALLVVAFLTDDGRDIHRTRRLNVLADIFADRLREEIREKQGAAYSTAAFSWPSRSFPGYGLFLSYLPVAPQALTPVLVDVKAIARQIATEGITADELQRALEPTLTGIREQLRQNDYWLNTVLMGATRHPDQIEWSRTILDDYTRIEARDLVALARKYLDPDKSAVFKARPADTPTAQNDNPA